MEPLSVLVSLTFILTTGLAVGLLYHAAHRSKRLLWVLLAWLLVQGGLAGSGFYAVTNTVPPRLALALVPALLAIAGLVGTARGRCFMAGLRLDTRGSSEKIKPEHEQGGEFEKVSLRHLAPGLCTKTLISCSFV